MSRPPSAEAVRRSAFERWFGAGVEAVAPKQVLKEALGAPGGAFQLLGEALPAGVGVVGLAIGKAACAMARELTRTAGPLLRRGLAITKQGHSFPVDGWEVREASHPVPDDRSAAAGLGALSFVKSAKGSDVLVVLLSGGASSLTWSPISGISLDDIAGVGAWLLASGADIEEVNCVRKHLGAVGGGKLALASNAGRVHLFAISDVCDDRLDVIGSGPCTGDPTTWAEALDVVRRHGGLDRLPESVLRLLQRGARGEIAETPEWDHPKLVGVHADVVAGNADARRAVCAAARADGVASVVDGGLSLAGEARVLGSRLVAEARADLRARGGNGLYVAGGETTVTLTGSGEGGRCQELALAAALAEAGQRDWALMAAGTDGGDGPTDAAGAHADGLTVARGARAGWRATDALRSHDSHRFFRAEGGVLRTGPTQTNVMDLVMVGIGELPPT
jgi:glycerate-2-kinase